MKLGIIGAPEAKTLVHAKELGLDFVEFDLNPTEFSVVRWTRSSRTRTRSKRPLKRPALKSAR